MLERLSVRELLRLLDERHLLWRVQITAQDIHYSRWLCLTEEAQSLTGAAHARMKEARLAGDDAAWWEANRDYERGQKLYNRADRLYKRHLESR